MTPAEIGALMQGVGAVGSAFGSRQSGTSLDSSMWRQEYYAPRIAAATMEAQVNQARAMGLHGSLALGAGSGPGVSPVSVGGGDPWSGIGDVGRVVSSLGSKEDRRQARVRQTNQINKEYFELLRTKEQLLQDEVQVEILKAQLGRLLGPIPLWITVMGDSGPVKILNPELSESFQEGGGLMSIQKSIRESGGKLPWHKPPPKIPYKTGR